MVDTLYTYFLKLAPTLFFQSQSSSSHVLLRAIFSTKTWKIIAKLIFGDCLIKECCLIRVWLHVTIREMQFSSEKRSSSACIDTIDTCQSRVRHAEWRWKRLLKSRATLSTHPRGEVDRVRKAKYSFNQKVYPNKYTFCPLY